MPFNYVNYPGGELMSPNSCYSQAVVIPASAKLIFAAGQGGWDENGKVLESYEEQAKQAFINCELALKAAGASFDDVIRVESFHVPLVENEGVITPVVERLSELKNKPAWTAVSVSSLAAPNMLIEIQVTAALTSQ